MTKDFNSALKLTCEDGNLNTMLDITHERYLELRSICFSYNHASANNITFGDKVKQAYTIAENTAELVLCMIFMGELAERLDAKTY